MRVLIPSVMALRETAMTAPLGQQGEPLAANGRPYKKNWCHNPPVIPEALIESVGVDAHIDPQCQRLVPTGR